MAEARRNLFREITGTPWPPERQDLRHAKGKNYPSLQHLSLHDHWRISLQGLPETRSRCWRGQCRKELPSDPLQKHRRQVLRRQGGDNERLCRRRPIDLHEYRDSPPWSFQESLDWKLEPHPPILIIHRSNQIELFDIAFYLLLEKLFPPLLLLIVCFNSWRLELMISKVTLHWT